eukprot:gene13208-14560_t
MAMDEIKKTLKEGALPRFKLPEKTLPPKVQTERPSGHILKREAASNFVSIQNKPCYKNYKDLITRAQELKLDLRIDETEEGCIISTYDSKHIPPKYELFIDESLEFVLHRTSCLKLRHENSRDPKKGSCFKCTEREKYEFRQLKKKERIEITPTAPLTTTNPSKVVLALKESRLNCKQFEKELKQMKLAIENSSKPITSELSNDLRELFGKCGKRRIPDFMKLLWKEQQKYLQESPSQVRYHPMIIKFCLFIAAKSSSAYKELRLDEKTGSGVLVLPSLRTLRDYRKVIKPRRGTNP